LNLGVKRVVPNIPFPIVLGLSYIIDGIAGLLGISHPVKPERVKKLKINNLIIPGFLIENGYEFQYTLTEALEDWKRDASNEW